MCVGVGCWPLGGWEKKVDEAPKSRGHERRRGTRPDLDMPTLGRPLNCGQDPISRAGRGLGRNSSDLEPAKSCRDTLESPHLEAASANKATASSLCSAGTTDLAHTDRQVRTVCSFSSGSLAIPFPAAADGSDHCTLSDCPEEVPVPPRTLLLGWLGWVDWAIGGTSTSASGSAHPQFIRGKEGWRDGRQTGQEHSTVQNWAALLKRHPLAQNRIPGPPASSSSSFRQYYCLPSHPFTSTYPPLPKIYSCYSIPPPRRLPYYPCVAASFVPHIRPPRPRPVQTPPIRQTPVIIRPTTHPSRPDQLQLPAPYLAD